jgi:hypothetical protein
MNAEIAENAEKNSTIVPFEETERRFLRGRSLPAAEALVFTHILGGDGDSR